MRTLRLLAPLLAVALLTTASAAAQLPAPEVAEVRFAGVRALDPDTLRAVVATRGETCRSALLASVCALGDWRWAEQPFRLNEAELERDEEAIEALYATRGFPSAEVTAEVIPRGGDEVVVRFNVREGPPQVVRSVALDTAGLPPVRLPPLPLRPGVLYSAPRIEETQRRIASRLAESGHPFAQVEVGADIRGDSVEVRLDVIPGPRGVVGGAEIVAEPPLSEAEVRRRLAFRPGEVFRPRALERTLERLYALPLVENVTISPATAAAGDSVVVPRIVVETRRATGVGADVTVGSYDCIGGTVRWSARHLLGEPRVVSLSAGASNLFADLLSESFCSGAEAGELADPNYLLEAEWREPLGPDTWLSLRAGYQRLAVARAYVRRGASARAALAHDLGRGWSGAVAYAPEWSDLGAVRPMYCVLVGSCAGALPGELAGTPLLAPVELSAAWEPRRARRPGLGPLEAPDWMLPLAPQWLYSARATLGAAGPPTASEFTYARLSAEGALTRLLGRRSELAARLRLGALASGEEVVPPQVRLYGGGPQGVRGVAPNLLGPKYLLWRADREELPCELRDVGCIGTVVQREDVLLRPLGGDFLLEASLEGRLWAARWLQLAAFVDAGGVTTDVPDSLRVRGSEWLVTPGVGALVLSPVGPVRVDVAYLPAGEERFPLIARQEDASDYVYLGRVGIDRFAGGGWEGFRRRLRVHFYLGLPF